MDLALEKDLQQKRRAEEKIAVFMPKRNIETWIHYLNGQVVDEKTPYSKLSRPRDCKPGIKKLVQICPGGLPKDAPPSLHTAGDELQRILPSKQ